MNQHLLKITFFWAFSCFCQHASASRLELTHPGEGRWTIFTGEERNELVAGGMIARRYQPVQRATEEPLTWTREGNQGVLATLSRTPVLGRWTGLWAGRNGPTLWNNNAFDPVVDRADQSLILTDADCRDYTPTRNLFVQTHLPPVSEEILEKQSSLVLPNGLVYQLRLRMNFEAENNGYRMALQTRENETRPWTTDRVTLPMRGDAVISDETESPLVMNLPFAREGAIMPVVNEEFQVRFGEHPQWVMPHNLHLTMNWDTFGMDPFEARITHDGRAPIRALRFETTTEPPVLMLQRWDDQEEPVFQLSGSRFEPRP
jgi:hypothetical protein